MYRNTEFLKNKQSIFWVCQAFGWTVFYFGLVMVGFQFFDNVPTMLLAALIGTVTGLIISLFLRLIYRRLWKLSLGTIFLALWAVLISVTVGAIWNFFILQIFIELQLYSQEVIAQLPFTVNRFVTLLGTPFRSIALIAWSALYFGAKYWWEYQSEHERGLAAKAEEHKAKLAMLKSQLNPHFLFNTLNSLRALIDENPFLAKTMISDLADYLRYTFQNPFRNKITIKEEIESVKTFLDL